MHPWTLRIIGLLFGTGVLALALTRPQSLGFEQKPKAPAEKARIQQASAPISPVLNSDSAARAIPRKDRFTTQEDGSPVPNLAGEAPRSIRFGVILFPYVGSQAADADAPSRSVALATAAGVIPEARADFTAAIKKGDRSSLENAGRIEQGVLEPSVEYAVFRLKRGEVSDVPIDTPRGFWVVKRHD